jgi:hypothetical protein
MPVYSYMPLPGITINTKAPSSSTQADEEENDPPPDKEKERKKKPFSNLEKDQKGPSGSRTIYWPREEQ